MEPNWQIVGMNSPPIYKEFHVMGQMFEGCGVVVFEASLIAFEGLYSCIQAVLGISFSNMLNSL